jgi:hypothetical protein
MAIVDGEVILASDILGVDSGWTALELLGGFTGSARWRTVGKVGVLEFDIGGSITAEVPVTQAIPSGSRPSGTPGGIIPAALYVTPAGDGSAWLASSTGVLRASSRGGAALTQIRGSISWLLP